MRWKDVSFSHGTLSIRVSLQWVGGKPILDELKTDSSKRTISLPPFAIEALHAHRERQLLQMQSMEAEWKNMLGLVFTTGKGTPLHEVNVSRYFHRLLAKAEVPQIRFYDLRHTCASLLIAQEVHARVIMDLLGHSDIGVTMNTYAHLMQASKDEAARRMQDLIGPSESE